jgi:hypothetical protein
MTEAEVKNIAELTATEALRKFMLMIGVDVSTPPAILELQKDFAKVRSLRTVERKIGDKVLTTLAGSAVTFLVAAVGFYAMHSGGH